MPTRAAEAPTKPVPPPGQAESVQPPRRKLPAAIGIPLRLDPQGDASLFEPGMTVWFAR